MKQRERITREDLGKEDAVGDTELTSRTYKGFTSNPFKSVSKAQTGTAVTVGLESPATSYGKMGKKDR